MKKTKKLLLGCVVGLSLMATTVTAFAGSNYLPPVEAGKLDEFKSERILMKKESLAAQVEAGIITQEKADEILQAIEENQALCDGTGTAKIGQKMGAKFGSEGKGQGLRGKNGKGENRGLGMGRGRGNGQHINNGVCSNQ